MSTQKIVETWEREKGMMLVVADHTLLKKNVSEDEFMKLTDTQGWRGVNYTDRIKFLNDNGYEVNRENLTNPELSAIPRET
jgi:hypothetical protein